MAHLQPFLHDLTGVFSAPIQAWSDPHGQVRRDGAQGIHCGDDRVISSSIVTVDGTEPEWASTQVTSGQELRFLSFVRFKGAGADPLVQRTRTRTATGRGIREELRVEAARDEPLTLEVAWVRSGAMTPA